uniref:Secreted protein n=1 Tax=Strigamia maritima TaxID=126957 RepID=T1J684_STRMM
MAKCANSKIFFFLLILIHSSWAQTLFDLFNGSNFHIRSKRDNNEESEPGNANQYFDELLNNTKQLIIDRGYDPLNIGRIDICDECQLEGLTSIKRTGDSTVIQEGDDVILQTNVGFEELRANCQCAKKILFITFRGHLSAVLRDLAMRGTIRTSTAVRLHPVLEHFVVTNNGDLDMHWEGKGILSFVSEGIFSLFKSKFRNHAQKALPDLLRTTIQNNLHRVTSLGSS